MLCQHVPMQDRNSSRALGGGCNMLKPLSHGQREALTLGALLNLKRFAMPEEVSLMAALDACGRGAPAPSCPQGAPNEFDVRKLVPWNMATS